MSVKPLELRFDPHTVEHLGSQMYSRLPNAVAELVANAYDADATQAKIQIIGTTAGDQIIQVHDDGHGMDRKDLQEKYLRIGRNRRAESNSVADLSEGGRRQVSGKKGIGKLALFGIGDRVRVQTTRGEDTQQFQIELDYRRMLAGGSDVYRPALTVVDVDSALQGTTIRLSGLRRTSLINAEHLANSLSRLFNYSEEGDDRFSVAVIGADGDSFAVDRTRRINAIDVEYTWHIPDDLPGVVAEAVREFDISGTIVSSVPTLPEVQRGVTTFVRGRLANEPEFYGASSTSFAFSYMTGYLDIDKIDELGHDLIASDRRSINWETDETATVREVLAEMITWIGRDRRRRQRNKKQTRVKKSRGIDIDGWSDTIRGPEAKPLDRLLDGILEDDSISDRRLESIVGDLEEIAPEYASLYWRHLHDDIQSEVGKFYKSKDYFKAVDQAIRLYIDVVREKSGAMGKERDVLQQAFKDNEPLLDVARPYMGVLTEDSAKNLISSQKGLSDGMLAGFRNLPSHERESVLIDHGIFTDSDCLDALGIISYLYSRVKALDDNSSTETDEAETDGDEARS